MDVNVFRGPELLATSEGDLFASGLLPQRRVDRVGGDHQGDWADLIEEVGLTPEAIAARAEAHVGGARRASNAKKPSGAFGRAFRNASVPSAS